MVRMAVKRLVKIFVVMSIVAVGASTAYHHYVEDSTPTSAVRQALEEYNSVLNAAVTAALDLVDQQRS